MGLTAAVGGPALFLPALLHQSPGFSLVPGSSPTPPMPSQTMNRGCSCESVLKGQPATPGRVAGWALDVSPWSWSPGVAVWSSQSGNGGNANPRNHPHLVTAPGALNTAQLPHPRCRWVHNTNSLRVTGPTRSPGLVRMLPICISGHHP